MKDLQNAGAGRARAGAALLAAGEPADRDEGSSACTTAARAYLGRHVWLAVLLIGCGAVATAAALVSIDRSPDSGAALFAVQFAGVLCGPVAVFVGVGWVYVLARRRRAVGLRHWVTVPAQASSLGFGPVRLTVVALELGPTTTMVIFPEQLFRSRIRRLVERDGRMLVLWPRRGRILDRVLYAGVDGHPVFGEVTGVSADPHSYWQRRAAAALSRSADVRH